MAAQYVAGIDKTEQKFTILPSLGINWGLNAYWLMGLRSNVIVLGNDQLHYAVSGLWYNEWHLAASRVYFGLGLGLNYGKNSRTSGLAFSYMVNAGYRFWLTDQIDLKVEAFATSTGAGMYVEDTTGGTTAGGAFGLAVGPAFRF